MRALVTGATGFLGGALARRLHALGHDVLATGRDVTAGRALAEAGVRFVRADLGDAEAIARLCAGQDRVFHCAGLSSLWGRKLDFQSANITGTEHVLRACARAGVGRLIHLSSPSVCMDSRHRLNIGEDEALPRVAINTYAWSKREAEQRVLAAARNGLPVVVLRPQAVFGPGDRSIFPRILRMAQRGVFPCFGNGESLIDVTCLANAVDALVLAATAPPGCLGQIYHISNGEPWNTQRLLDRLFQELGLRVRRPHVPYRVAYAIAGALELVHRAAGLRREPRLTRYSVCVLARTRTLDITKARRDLGYQPAVAVETGIREFAAAWRPTHAAV